MAQTSSLRSFLSLIALVCLIGGTFATALGLIKIGEDSSDQFMADEEYIIPTAVGNTLCVIFLIWLTATVTTRSTAYKLTVIIVLILGIIGEIYMTFFFTKPPQVYGTYFLITVNFLIRTFYVLEYVQDSWSPVSWSDYAGAYKPPTTSNTPAAVSNPPAQKKPEMDDKTKEIKKKIGEAVTKMRADPKQFDGSTQDKAYKAFNAAITSGMSSDDAYKAAKAELKYADSTPYTGASRHRA